MVFNPFDADGYPNLVNVANRLDPDGSIADIAEILSLTNEILDDAVFVEGNLPTGHRTTVRAGIPRGTWRKFNYGIRPKKSGTVQIDDSAGMLENRSQVDVKLAALNGNTNEFLLSESTAILEGLNEDLAETIFYGDSPDKFLGFAPRYDELGTPSGKPVANSYMDQVIDMGGTGTDLTSIWLILWSPTTVHMFYPKKSMAGLETKDLGEIDAYDQDGGVFRARATLFGMNMGLCVRDWRYVVRLANIDLDVLTGTDSSAELARTNLWHKMITALNTIPNLRVGRAAFYMNRGMKTIFDIAAAEKTNALLTMKDVFGKHQTTFWGVPLKQCDSILNTEAALVSA